jgi:hypothetical protein
MNVKNDEHVKMHAELNWCINIFERLDEMLKKYPVAELDVKSLHWLVKQGLKSKKED